VVPVRVHLQFAGDEGLRRTQAEAESNHNGRLRRDTPQGSGPQEGMRRVRRVAPPPLQPVDRPPLSRFQGSRSLGFFSSRPPSKGVASVLGTLHAGPRSSASGGRNPPFLQSPSPPTTSDGRTPELGTLPQQRTRQQTIIPRRLVLLGEPLFSSEYSLYSPSSGIRPQTLSHSGVPAWLSALASPWRSSSPLSPVSVCLSHFRFRHSVPFRGMVLYSGVLCCGRCALPALPASSVLSLPTAPSPLREPLSRATGSVLACGNWLFA